MLYLTRKQNEKVYIGNNITVEIISIQGKQVRLGFCAPDSVAIIRSELMEKIQNSVISGQSEASINIR